MRHLPSLELMRHELRAHICPHCARRPRRSASLGPEVPRSCEPRCAIFVNLPEIREAARLLDPMLESYARLIRQMLEEICENCRKKHDGCRATRFCALLRYREKVARVLNDLVERSPVQ